MSKTAKRVWVHVLALCIALIGTYSLVGFIVLPYWIERKLPELRDSVGDVSVEDLAINPFLLTATVRGLTLAKDQQPPLMHVGEVVLDLSLASVVKRAWVVETLVVRSPQINIVREAGGKLNIDALQKQSSDGGASGDIAAVAGKPPLPSFVLQAISVQDGLIRYLDRTQPMPVQIVVGPFVVHANGLGTLSDDPGSFWIQTVLPRSGSAHAEGNLTLWPIASDGAVLAQGIRIAKPAALAMTTGVIDPPQGRLDLSFHYGVSLGDEKANITLDDLTVALTDLSLRRSGTDEAMVELSSLKIVGGTVDYNERAIALGNVDLRGGRVAAHLDAEGRLDLTGIAEAFASDAPDSPADRKPWEVAVAAFRLDQVKFAYTAEHGGTSQAASIGNGSMILSGNATIGAERVEAQLRDIGLNLRDIQIGDPTENPTLLLTSFHLQGGFADSRTRQIAAEAVDLSDGRLALVRAADGILQFPGIRPSAAGDRNRDPRSAETAHAAASQSPTRPWQIGAEALRLNRIGLRYADRSAPAPLSLEIAPSEAALRVALTVGASSMRARATDLRLDLDGIALSHIDADKPAITLGQIRLTGGTFDTDSRAARATSLQFDGLRAHLLRTESGLIELPHAEASRSLQSSSEPDAKPEAASTRHAEAWSVRIDRIEGKVESMRYVDHAWSPAFTASLGEATLGVALDFVAGDSARMVVGDLDARLNGVTLQRSDLPGAAEIERIVIEQGGLDTASRRIVAQSIVLAGGQLPLVRTDRGVTELAGFARNAAKQSAGDAPAEPDVWLYDVARLKIENVGLALADHSYASDVAYDVTLDGSVRNLRSEHAQPIAVDATARFAQGGSIRAEGTVAQAFSAGTVRLQANELALAPLAPILEQYAFLRVASGIASGEAEIVLGETPERPRVRIAGNLQLADVLIHETGTARPVVSWKLTDAREIAIGIEPNRIDIAEVRVSAPQAELTISEDRTLNWSRLIRDDGQEARAGGKRWQDVFPIRIGRISVTQGQMQFSDLSLVLPFSTQIDELRGAVVGLSSAADARAELALTGSIADYGSASARGGLNAFDPTAFLDIEAKFDNVLIPPFSPYTATFAGRTIESGRLWLDLEYRIVERQLSGQNKISVRNLELGKRVEAPNAADLPLELAVALLEDDQGRINLQIPVTGNVGDPRFDYGSVIANAISSALGRIVSAPFRALASLFGGDDADEVRMVQFKPGDADLIPAERQQLAQVAKALQARPALRLLVQGPYDPVRDGRALRERELRRAVSAALGRATDESAPADPIALSDPPTRDILEAMLLKRLSEADYRAFKQISGPSDSHYYEGILAELAARIEIDEGQLRLLAANRARAIASALTERGISADRIATSELSLVNDDSKAVAATLEVDVHERSSKSLR